MIRPSTRIIIGFISLYLSSSLSSAAGVGGGSVNVAIFYIIMGNSFHDSVILSLATLFGNYSFQVIINWNKRHPYDPTRQLIYWDVILLLLPSQLGGGDLGVILGYIVPETILVIFALFVLLIASGLTLIKGIKIYDRESIELQLSNVNNESQRLLTSVDIEDNAIISESDDDHVVLTPPIRSTSNPNIPILSLSIDDNNLSSYQNQSNEPLIHSHRSSGVLSNKSAESYLFDRPVTPRSFHFAQDDDNEAESNLPDLDVPWLPIVVIVVAWAIYATLYVVMNDVTFCSWRYYFFLSTLFPICIMEVIWGYYYLINKHENVQFAYTPASHTSSIAVKNPLNESGNDDDTTDNNANTKNDYDNENERLNRKLSMRESTPRDVMMSPRQNKSITPRDGNALTPRDILNMLSTPRRALPGDIDWNRSAFMPIIVVLAAFNIGITSALLGIGGGELMGPLLLKLKVLPQVSSATVPVMSLLNTSSSIIHYMTIDEFPYLSAFYTSIIGALGGITGRFIAYNVMYYLKRTSILVFFLVGVLVLSIVLFAYELSVETADFQIGHYC